VSKSKAKQIREGDWVTFKLMPKWVSQLPMGSQEVFRLCIGKTYRVDEITKEGLLVLDVSTDADRKFGGFMNDIRVEPMYVVLASGKKK
jgi:hypothetical protein